MLGMLFLKNSILNLRRRKLIHDIDEFPFTLIRNGVILKIKARTKQLVTLPVIDPDIIEGYLPKIDAGPGVYLGQMLVSQKNGRIKIFLINVNFRDIEFTIPAVKLEEFDVINTAIHKEEVNYKNNTSSIIGSRVKESESCLKLEEINEQERNSLLMSIKKYSFQFKLKNDKLEGTNLVQHKIITTDE